MVLVTPCNANTPIAIAVHGNKRVREDGPGAREGGVAVGDVVVWEYGCGGRVVVG